MQVTGRALAHAQRAEALRAFGSGGEITEAERQRANGELQRRCPSCCRAGLLSFAGCAGGCEGLCLLRIPEAVEPGGE